MIIMKIKEFFIQAFCLKHDYSEFAVEHEYYGLPSQWEFLVVCKKCGKVIPWQKKK